LNLHGIRKRWMDDDVPFGPIYSNTNAVGIVMATGNVGDSLDTTGLDDVNTYISRDAGWTWYEIDQGSNIYEFADFGSLLLMADNLIETDTVQYSWDQGHTWTQLKITATPMEITNIMVEPGLTTQQFLVFGFRVIDEQPTAVIVHVNFEGFYDTKCVQADYEWFIPYDSKSEGTLECLMGETQAYGRRIYSKACYNGPDFEVEKDIKQCPCSLDDYECDFCYSPVGGQCSTNASKIPGCEGHDQPPLDCDDTYELTQGWRLIPGTRCDPNAGLNLLPKTVPCPGRQHSSDTKNAGHALSGGIVALIVIIVLIVFGTIVGALLYAYKHRTIPGFPGWGHRGLPSYPGDSTALDDDLLQAKDAEPLDDNAIQQSLTFDDERK